ncbi:hypothetical protein ACQPZF_18225 [Actinosynnema sp. CS-041913]|uniref:hypothetical protein n=1 Tax=Actinosynnema sp. CS-041913 TaxID=3239917 RepID=UPI003D8D3318
MNRVGPVVVLLAAFAVGGCATSEVGKDVGRPSSTQKTLPTPDTPTNDPVLEEAASSLGPLLESGFPDTYSGLRLDQDKGVVVVYRRPDPALDEAARAAARGAGLELVDAKHSLKRLREVIDRINADVEYWKTKGVQLTTWGPAVDGSAVNVTTVAGSESDRVALAARYGEDVIRVTQGDFPTPAPATT